MSLLGFGKYEISMCVDTMIFQHYQHNVEKAFLGLNIIIA